MLGPSRGAFVATGAVALVGFDDGLGDEVVRIGALNQAANLSSFIRGDAVIRIYKPRGNDRILGEKAVVRARSLKLSSLISGLFYLLLRRQLGGDGGKSGISGRVH